MSWIRHFELNRAGRDFAVGDIHGHFTRLQSALDSIGFDSSVDRLFSVGDLVDRGPESGQVLEWLARPWFHAVRGNHEDIAVRHVKNGKVDPVNYTNNGGGWFLQLDHKTQHAYAQVFETLPLAMEVETPHGLVGLMHADCPTSDWANLEAKFQKRRSARDRAMWSRQRIEDDDTSRVKGVHAVVVGHTPVREPVVLGNVFHIDTRGWKPNGYFTLLELGRLELKKKAELSVVSEATHEMSITGRVFAALRELTR